MGEFNGYDQNIDHSRFYLATPQGLGHRTYCPNIESFHTANCLKILSE
jgi:hypothetical protein